VSRIEKGFYPQELGVGETSMHEGKERGFVGVSQVTGKMGWGCRPSRERQWGRGGVRGGLHWIKEKRKRKEKTYILPGMGGASWSQERGGTTK